ncbi:MAG TPA: RsmD family RNA methyltransferase [Gemmataceae bacterium]|nr:RsmD family RNA methyltransferase [Gemmataceae bacterium]
MRTQLRIVAGRLRGRKLTCTISPDVRPTPQMVREALFSILGNAVPDVPFYDIFAGTGAIGLEALSRGASAAIFVERDFGLTRDLRRHLEAFGVADEATLLRADAYHWVRHWQAPEEPVNVFISPPFPDFERRRDDLLALVGEVQRKVYPGSVVVLQAERGVDLGELPFAEQWERRRYGRNELLIWVKGPS